MNEEIMKRHERDRAMADAVGFIVGDDPLDLPSIERQMWHSNELGNEPFLSDGYDWTVKPHRVMDRAIREIRELRKFVNEEMAPLRQLAQTYERELSAVMPPDFKDWWENDRTEWPLVAKSVIEGLREREHFAYEHADRLATALDAARNLLTAIAGCKCNPGKAADAWLREHGKPETKKTQDHATGTKTSGESGS
jgi:hypothetical protein